MLEAAVYSECGPSRSDRGSTLSLEPAAWGSVIGPLKRSSHAGFGFALPNAAVRRANPALWFCMQAPLHAGRDANSRDWCAPLPYGRSLTISRRLLRPSPRSRDSKFRMFGGGARMGSTPSPLGVLLPSTFTKGGTWSTQLDSRRMDSYRPIASSVYFAGNRALLQIASSDLFCHGCFARASGASCPSSSPQVQWGKCDIRTPASPSQLPSSQSVRRRCRQRRRNACDTQ